MNRTRIFTALACLAVFSFVLLLPGCVKEKADKVPKPEPVANFDLDRMWDCHNTDNPYPSQITGRIIGTWVWQSNRCFWTGDTTFSADRHVVITFTDGGLYKVFEDGKIESEGSFTLSQVDDKIWHVVTSSVSQYLHGYIILCKNEVVFYSSYMDGCDFYFVRK